MAGPLSPPLSRLSRLSTFSPPLVFLPPWQGKHVRASTGRISISKRSSSAGAPWADPARRVASPQSVNKNPAFINPPARLADWAPALS